MVFSLHLWNIMWMELDFFPPECRSHCCACHNPITSNYPSIAKMNRKHGLRPRNLLLYWMILYWIVVFSLRLLWSKLYINSFTKMVHNHPVRRWGKEYHPDRGSHIILHLCIPNHTRRTKGPKGGINFAGMAFEE